MKRVVLYIFCFSILSLNIWSQAGPTKSQLEEEKSSALKELRLAKELLEKTSSEKSNSLRQIKLLNKSIYSRQKVISAIEKELLLIDGEVEDLEFQINSLQESIDKGKKEYAELIKSIYKNHTEEEKLMYLFASENLNQFYQRIKYLKYLKDYRERKIREIEYLMVELDRKKQELLIAREEKSGLLEQKEEESRELVVQRNGKNSLVNRLSQDERRLQREIREKERIREELEAEIRRIIEEEARKNAGRNSYEMLTPEQKLISDAFVQNKGRLPWPVEKGVVTLAYGWVDLPYARGVKFENPGVDITTTSGSEARAVFDGEVTNIFAILGANYNVMIVHGEYRTLYQNLVDLKVKVGDKVSTKQVLGTIHSEVGKNTAEMHFQVLKGKESFNPESWLSK